MGMEELSQKVVKRVIGTVRALMLPGKNKSSNIVVALYDDQKPFHMICHTTEDIV